MIILHAMKIIHSGFNDNRNKYLFIVIILIVISLIFIYKMDLFHDLSSNVNSLFCNVTFFMEIPVINADFIISIFSMI